MALFLFFRAHVTILMAVVRVKLCRFRVPLILDSFSMHVSNMISQARCRDVCCCKCCTPSTKKGSRRWAGGDRPQTAACPSARLSSPSSGHRCRCFLFCFCFCYFCHVCAVALCALVARCSSATLVLLVKIMITVAVFPGPKHLFQGGELPPPQDGEGPRLPPGGWVDVF